MKTNTLLDRTGAPLCTWSLAMNYFYFVLNHVYNSTIQHIPINAAAGLTCEISHLLRFRFWQPVYLNSDDSSFPSDSTEEIGRSVGISENLGNNMTFSILNTTTNKVISRSNVSPIGEPTSLNLMIDPLTTPEVVTSRHPPLENAEDN